MDSIDDIECEYHFRRQTIHYKFNIFTALSCSIIFIGSQLLWGFNVYNSVWAVGALTWLGFSIHRYIKIIEEKTGKPENPISAKSLLDD